MISVDGAGLIAQVLPVGILVLAVERRALGGTPYPTGGLRRVSWWLQYIVAGVAVGGSVVSVILAVAAVSSNVPLSGADAVVVGTSGFLLAFAVGGVTVPLAMRSYRGVGPSDR